MEGFTLCAFKWVTGLRCPGCGLCHSILAILQGKIGLALHENPAGIFVVMFAFYWGFRVFPPRGWKLLVSTPAVETVERVFGLVLVVALFTQWIFYLCCQTMENLKKLGFL